MFNLVTSCNKGYLVSKYEPLNQRLKLQGSVRTKVVRMIATLVPLWPKWPTVLLNALD